MQRHREHHGVEGRIIKRQVLAHSLDVSLRVFEIRSQRTAQHLCGAFDANRICSTVVQPAHEPSGATADIEYALARHIEGGVEMVFY